MLYAACWRTFTYKASLVRVRIRIILYHYKGLWQYARVETWGHVPDPIVMAHALAELRYGIVAHQYESGFKCGYISAQTL